MQISSADLSADAAYKLLFGSIVPRPIAWVTTLASHGGVNLAPFSAFTFVSQAPPMVGISLGLRAGALKDTARHIAREREFVVNIAAFAQLEPLHRSAEPFAEAISEVEALGLRTAPCIDVRTPRLADAPVSLECVLHALLPFGNGGSQFAVGEVKRFHVRDDLHADGKIDSIRLDPIARLGGPRYARLGEIVTMAAASGPQAAE